MNCKNFESLIDETARGRLMDAAEREGALGHTADCARCAALLADGRALTAGLRTLAAQSSAAEAPARVEAALLAAFRERHAAAAAEAADTRQPHTQDDTAAAAAPHTPAPQSAPQSAPPANVARARVSAWRLPQWAQAGMVAAASVLLVVGLYGIFREQSSPTPSKRVAQSGGQGSGAARKENARAEVKSAPAPAGNVHDVAAGNVIDGNVTDDDDSDDAHRGHDSVAPRRGGRQAGVVRAQPASYNGNAGRRVGPSPGRADARESAPAEIATEFIPLVNGGRLSPGDSGHVMRVEVPRSALASFGLPVNMDIGAGGRVKADVLMGEDGIARAIRFVR